MSPSPPLRLHAHMHGHGPILPTPGPHPIPHTQPHAHAHVPACLPRTAQLPTYALQPALQARRHLGAQLRRVVRDARLRQHRLQLRLARGAALQQREEKRTTKGC